MDGISAGMSVRTPTHWYQKENGFLAGRRIPQGKCRTGHVRTSASLRNNCRGILGSSTLDYAWSPQTPAAILIGSNSESLGCKLRTTIFQRPDVALAFFTSARNPSVGAGFAFRAKRSPPPGTLFFEGFSPSLLSVLCFCENRLSHVTYRNQWVARDGLTCHLAGGGDRSAVWWRGEAGTGA